MVIAWLARASRALRIYPIVVVVPKPGKPLFALPLNPNVVFVFVLDVVVVPKPGKPLFGLPLNPNVEFVVTLLGVPKPGKPLF